MTENIIKISLAAICGVVLSAVIKNKSREYSVLISLALSAFIMMLSLSMFSDAVSAVRVYAESLDVDTVYLGVVLKVLAIGYITGFAAQTARDAGENAIAVKVEAAGRAACALCALPVLKSLVQMLSGMGW